jgi:hypothetical protein
MRARVRSSSLVIRDGTVNSQLFQMNDAAVLVGFEAGFFDDIVEPAGPFYPLKSEVRVGLVSGY